MKGQTPSKKTPTNKQMLQTLLITHRESHPGTVAFIKNCISVMPLMVLTSSPILAELAKDGIIDKEGDLRLQQATLEWSVKQEPDVRNQLWNLLESRNHADDADKPLQKSPPGLVNACDSVHFFKQLYQLTAAKPNEISYGRSKLLLEQNLFGDKKGSVPPIDQRMPNLKSYVTENKDILGKFQDDFVYSGNGVVNRQLKVAMPSKADLDDLSRTSRSFASRGGLKVTEKKTTTYFPESDHQASGNGVVNSQLAVAVSSKPDLDNLSRTSRSFASRVSKVTTTSIPAGENTAADQRSLLSRVSKVTTTHTPMDTDQSWRARQTKAPNSPGRCNTPE